MSHKTRNIIILSVFLFIISCVGIYVCFILQTKQLKKVNAKIENLNKGFVNASSLRAQLDELIKRSKDLDSLLINAKKVIPFKFNSTETFNDIIKFTEDFSDNSKIDIEYEKTETKGSVFYDIFNLKGVGKFDDVYDLIYRIEKDKKLYIFTDLNLSSSPVNVENYGYQYLVGFNLKLSAYYTKDSSLKLDYNSDENMAGVMVSDIFYPLITPEIPLNLDELFEVDGAQLLAILPDGVFLMDKKGISYSLQEGDPVFLGHLTKINREKSSCDFILNKGGIVEQVTIYLKNSPNQKEIKK